MNPGCSACNYTRSCVRSLAYLAIIYNRGVIDPLLRVASSLDLKRISSGLPVTSLLLHREDTDVFLRAFIFRVYRSFLFY